MEISNVLVEQRNKGLEVVETVAESVPETSKSGGIQEIPQNVELMPSSGDDIMVFARTPEEMARAQNALISAASRKLAKANEELVLAQQNFEEAKIAKIRTTGWRREIRKHEKEVKFYTKVHDALEAGYFIVPDFPLDIIAVRTTATEPADQSRERWVSSINDEVHEELPVGQGEYVDPTPKIYKVNEVEMEDGKEVKKQYFTAAGTQLQKMDFPFRLIKPHLLKDLDRASKRKIFDAIGVLPNKRRSPDPMLVGIIENKISRFQTKRIQFLISWWIPTSTL